MTLKVTVLMVESKIKVSGFTVMVMPAGDVIEALYVEFDSSNICDVSGERG